MRFLLGCLVSVPLLAQPEIFGLPATGSLVTSATIEPFVQQQTIDTRNTPAYLFRSADGTKLYSVARSATDTVVVLDALTIRPTVVLQRLNLPAATVAALSSDRRRLLVGSTAGLHVIDTASDQLIATIPGPPPVDIASSLDGQRAYVLASDQLTTVDLVTNAVLAVRPLPASANSVAVNYTSLVYVSALNRVIEIDGDTGALRRQIPVDGRPGRLVFAPDALTALAVNENPVQTIAVFRFDLVNAVVSGQAGDGGSRIDSVFHVGDGLAYAFSSAGYRSLLVTPEPFALSESTTFWSLIRSLTNEFPAPRAWITSSSDGFQFSPIGNRAVTRPYILRGLSGQLVVASLTVSGVPAHLYAFNGQQTAPPGSEYPLPLIVRVTDAVGRPLNGVPVRFSNGQTVFSNAEGWAQVRAVAPSNDRSVPVTASAAGAAAIFPLGAGLPAASSIRIVAGQGQIGRPGERMSSPLRVKLLDVGGLPLPGSPVDFQANAGAGSLACPSAARRCTVISDANGEAAVAFISGLVSSASTFEQQTVSVTSGAAPLRLFYVTATSNTVVAERSLPVSNRIEGPVNAVLPGVIQVRATLPTWSNTEERLPNVALTFRSQRELPEVACQGEAGVVMTDQNGLATCTLALGSKPGQLTIDDVIALGGQKNPGMGLLQLEVFPNNRPTLLLRSGGDQLFGRLTEPVPIVVQLRDAQGQPIPNEPVQWVVDRPGGVILPPGPSFTNSFGEASLRISSGPEVGTYTIRATAMGLSRDVSVSNGLRPSVVAPNTTLLTWAKGRFAVEVWASPFVPWQFNPLPNWIRTATPSGFGIRTVWFEYDENPSTESRREAQLFLATNLTVVQAPAAPPNIQNWQAAGSSGTTGTFTVGGYSTLGARDIQVINLLIQSSLDGRNACYLAYSVPLRLLYLVSDSGPESMAGAVVPGSSQVARNSQCSVVGTDVTHHLNEDFGISQLRVTINFSGSFTGPKLVYAASRDLRGRSSRWVLLGTHSIPAPPAYPAPVSVTPNINSPSPQPLTFAFDDEIDAGRLETIWILINSALDARQACYIAYHQPSNQLYLYPDSGDPSSLSSRLLNGPDDLTNSLCRIRGGGQATVSRSGRRLTLTLPIALNALAGDTLPIFTAVQSLSGQRSSWAPLGIIRHRPF